MSHKQLHNSFYSITQTCWKCHCIEKKKKIRKAVSLFLFRNLSEFSWKRCLFRTISMAFLLFIAESVPSFGSILNLVGGSTITCLTFIMPPLLYIFVMDHSEIRYLQISHSNLLSKRFILRESEFYVIRLKSFSKKKEKKSVLT